MKRLYITVIAIAVIISGMSALFAASVSNIPAPIRCPMPANCTTSATMDKWYVCKGRQQLQNLHVSNAECMARLLGIGARQSVAKIACTQ